MNTRFRLNLERVDEKITPVGDSTLSVVAPDGSQMTGSYDIPVELADPTLADHYVPTPTLDVTWKGVTYSGTGGAATNFLAMPMAHFKNGVFEGGEVRPSPAGFAGWPGGPAAVHGHPVGDRECPGRRRHVRRPEPARAR